MPTEPPSTRRIDRRIVTAQVLLGAALALAYLRADAASGLPWTWLALLLAGAAAGIGGAALLALRPVFRVAPTPRHDGVLVTHGIYRWLRHPMYNAVLLVVAAVALHRPDPWVLAAAGANVVFYSTKARYEEGLLRAHYPDYEAYRRRTLGVLPGW